MIISSPKIKRQKSYVELSVWAKPEHFPYLPERVWWRFPVEYADYIRPNNGNPLIPAFLLPCMVKGERLIIEAPVSPKLLAAVDKIQDLYLRGNNLTKISVAAPLQKTTASLGAAIGCFFSGGVDSFYSLLKNQTNHPNDAESITHLIFSAGFDIKLKRKALLKRVQTHLSEVAKKVSTELLQISTNQKYFGDKYLDWMVYGGTVLASIGLSLDALFRQITIPSSYAWGQLQPQFGVHPELDPLWSTEQLTFIHDGCEAKRVEKIVNHLSGSDLVLEHLHVCWQNRDVFYNCGACEKCLRTMIPFYVGTGLTTFPSFSQPLTIESVQKLKINSHVAIFHQENLELFNNLESEFDQQLKAALSNALHSVCE